MPPKALGKIPKHALPCYLRLAIGKCVFRRPFCLFAIPTRLSPMSDRLAVLPQYLLPKQALTRLAGRIAGARGGRLTTRLIFCHPNPPVTHV